jgi:hypothetical protein
MKNINDEFGQYTEVVEEPYKQKAISPFDFINSINYTKESLIQDDWSEKQYNSYVINKGLSFSPDTVIPANEMNSRPHLDKLLQYSFLINIIRSKKRFNKWIKPEKIEAIEIVKDYYGYSTEKARQVLSILTSEQIQTLKQKLQKGGVNDK